MTSFEAGPRRFPRTPTQISRLRVEEVLVPPRLAFLAFLLLFRFRHDLTAAATSYPDVVQRPHRSTLRVSGEGQAFPMVPIVLSFTTLLGTIDNVTF